MTLRVVGGRELRRELKAAGLSLQDLKDAHRDVAAIVAREAETPRDSGALAATVRVGATNRAAIVRAGNNTRVPYARVVHWRKTVNHPQGQPFLSDAAQRTEPKWLPLYEADVHKITDTVKGATR